MLLFLSWSSSSPSQVQEYYGFLPLTAYLAVNYMDRFLSLHRLPVSSLAPPSLFPYMNYFNICIQTYQQNMSTMCDEWIIVLVFPLHIILSYKSMVVDIEEVYMVSLHTVCVCVWWLSVGKFILKVQ